MIDEGYKEGISLKIYLTTCIKKALIKLSAISEKDWKTLKYDAFLIKHKFFLVFVTSTKIFKEKESIEILKFLGLINNTNE